MEIKAKRKAKAAQDQIEVLERNRKAILKAANESRSKAEDIEAAAYDLKAVNPNHKSNEDTRTSAELLDFIEAKGREADAALARLRSLVGRSN